MAHSTNHHETYTGAQVATEMERGNTQEAARELNNSLQNQSSKDFNKVYREANAAIDKYNKSHNTKLPHMELVHSDGQTNETTDSNRNNTTGIKVGDKTYNTDTVRNNKYVDPETGNQLITSEKGKKVETLDKNGDKVQTDPEGNTTKTYAEKNRLTDKDLGKIVSETVDSKGNKTIVNEKGDFKTTAPDGTEKTNYTNGDSSISRPDGSGSYIQHKDGHTLINSWSKLDHQNNYTVDINDQTGEFTKTSTIKAGNGQPKFQFSGKDYKYLPNETDPWFNPRRNT